MDKIKRILIVDDEELNRELLEQLMESFGHESVSAASGPAALELLSDEIDLILLDAMMPGMDGFETTRQVRAHPHFNQLPIIIVTALSGKEDRLRAVEAGANDFVTKPIDRVELRVRCTSLLRMKEAQDAIYAKQAQLQAQNESMAADLGLARAMQMALIVKPLPSFPRDVPQEESRLRLSHRYLPASALGGDFFDVLALSDKLAGIFICDVMGHGVRSALVTAMMRALVGENSSVATEPGLFLSAVNGYLVSILGQSGISLFASAFYGVLDVESGRLVYANAGHPSPIHVKRGAGQADWLLDPQCHSGPVLGLFPEAYFVTAETSLSPGDLLFLFTDGLFEVDGPDGEYGEDRLLWSVRNRQCLNTETLFDNLLQEVHAFASDPNFEDDVCLLGVELPSGPL